MFESMPLVVAFTVVFTVTGLYTLARVAVLVSGPTPDESGGDGRMAELSHLVMSVAMVGMTWGWTGGPDSASGVVQLVVFGLLAVWFLAAVARPGRHRRTGAVHHLLMAVAMVWMVAAMPRLMGMSTGSGTSASSHHGGHGDGGDMAGMAAAVGAGPAPAWMQLVTVAFVVLLCAAALTWAAAALRRAPVLVAAGAALPSAPPTEPPVLLRSGPRLDAACHVLMSLGMAGMLLAML